MKNKQHALVLIILLSTLSIAISACQSSAGDAEEDDSSNSGSSITYRGLRLDALGTYTATFELSFVADEDRTIAWSYHLDTLASEDPPVLQRSLAIDGAPARIDLGDLTLTLLGDTQYMTGQAVGVDGCLYFPATTDLEASLLTPDSLLPPELLGRALREAGKQTVNGQRGDHYNIRANSLGDYTNVRGDLVISDRGNAVLLYDLTANTIDELFTDGQAGELTWHFEITNFEPEIDSQIPAICELNFPVIDDAIDIVRLPGLIIYTSPSSFDDVLIFYREALEADGWLQYRFPAASIDTMVLVFAKEGKLLNISVSTEEDGTKVQLFLEEE